MSKNDLGGGYKRIVRYFWDPEPRNEDSTGAPIWCLGQRYTSRHPVRARPASKNRRKSGEESCDSTERTSAPSPLSHDSFAATKLKEDSVEQDTGWPADFLDDFESRFWFTYRSNFPPIKQSSDPKAPSSMTMAVRLRSQLLNQGNFTSDTGWGCMIRSGQSLLANALAMLHLGRGTLPVMVYINTSLITF